MSGIGLSTSDFIANVQLAASEHLRTETAAVKQCLDNFLSRDFLQMGARLAKTNAMKSNGPDHEVMPH